MPVIKLYLPIEDLNEWARLANERKESVRVTLSKFVSQEARKLTKRAADFCPVCGGFGSVFIEGNYYPYCPACNGTGQSG